MLLHHDHVEDIKSNFVLQTGVTFYRLQKKPKVIIMLALGLCGTEDSPYCQDLLDNLPESWLVATIRGYETSNGSDNEKLFMKNNTSRIKAVYWSLKNLYEDIPIVGVGISMGGALLIQSVYKKEVELNGLVIISTSLHYKHAIDTMHETFMGFIALRLLVSWQFWSLYYHPNFLHGHPKMSFFTWCSLYFSRNMLSQDKILAKLYDFKYQEYIDELDLRDKIGGSTRTHFLFSKNDPMFSKSHQRITMQALELRENVYYERTDFGNHGEFTKKTRNDYLVDYVIKSVNHCCSFAM